MNQINKLQKKNNVNKKKRKKINYIIQQIKNMQKILIDLQRRKKKI